MVLELIVFLFVLIIFSAVFSLIEISFISTTQSQVEAYLKQKRVGAKSLRDLKAEPRLTIITLLFCSTLVNFTAVALTTVFFITIFPSNGVLLSTILMTILILIFGQIVPKVIGEEFSEKVMLFFAKPTEILVLVLRPITFFFEKISRKIPFTTDKETTPEEFISMIKLSRKGGIISKKSETLINNLIEFQNLTADQIVTPHPQVKLFNETATVSSCLKVVSKFPFTHFPVYAKKETNIVGIISSVSLLNCLHKKKPQTKIKQLLKPAFIVPDTKNIEELLLDMEEKGEDVAIVINEYGDFFGIITREDILRKFLGKVPTKALIKSAKSLFSGETLVGAIEEKFSLRPFVTKHKTISGVILEKLQYVPKKGESFFLNGVTIEIVDSTETKIKIVKIKQ